jgi:hypothetical protein
MTKLPNNVGPLEDLSAFIPVRFSISHECFERDLYMK